MTIQLSDMQTLVQETVNACYEIHKNDEEYAGKFEAGGLTIGEQWPLTGVETRYSILSEVDYCIPHSNKQEEPSYYLTSVQINCTDWGYFDPQEGLPVDHSHLHELTSIVSYLRHPSYWQQTANQLYELDITSGTTEEIEAKKGVELKNKIQIHTVDYEIYATKPKNGIKGSQIIFTIKVAFS